MRANAAPPRVERKQPDTFYWTLSIRRYRSARLLSKGMVIADRPTEANRPFLTGSVEQVRDDVHQLAAWGSPR